MQQHIFFLEEKKFIDKWHLMNITPLSYPWKVGSAI